LALKSAAHATISSWAPCNIDKLRWNAERFIMGIRLSGTRTSIEHDRQFYCLKRPCVTGLLTRRIQAALTYRHKPHRRL